VKVANKRGPKLSRSRPALLFAVWRLIREEIAYRSSPPYVSTACARVIARVGKIRIDLGDGRGISKTIAHAPTLQQWYSRAEVERADRGSELSMRCDAWEREAKARFPARAGSKAAHASLLRSEQAGLFATGSHGIADERAAAAADHAASAAGSLPSPRKNRR
jgi:hypothetical protein